MSSLPQEVVYLLFACGWVKFKDKHPPVLVLSPFSLEVGDIIDEWTKKYTSWKNNGNILSNFPLLVYWYKKAGLNLLVSNGLAW